MWNDSAVGVIGAVSAVARVYILLLRHDGMDDKSFFAFEGNNVEIRYGVLDVLGRSEVYRGFIGDRSSVFSRRS